MGDVVNLNRYRKRQQRRVEDKQAVENRVKYGRSKAEVTKLRAETEREAKDLDDKRRE